MTLGERLALAADRLVRRRTAVVSWLDRAGPLLDRAETLDTAGGRRFERVEVPVPPPRGDPAVPWTPSVGHPAAPADDGPVVVPPAAPAHHDAATELPAALRDRLERLVGGGLDGVQIHRTADADDLARAHRADAVTVGDDIHFRTGLFRSDTPAGLALLAHEATHVVSGRLPHSSWRRASPSGNAAEEQLARRNAAAAHGAPSGPGPFPRPPQARRGAVPSTGAGPGRPAGVLAVSPPRSTAAAIPTATPGTTQRPMQAAEGSGGLAPASGAADAGVPDARSLRETLRRELLREIRTDAERGA